MKLFYAPGACSLASRIILEELASPYEVEQVDLKHKSCSSGDFFQINPRGQVPVLRMENGEFLTEGTAILQYLANQRPEAGLIPKWGTLEYYRALEWLGFISSELHKSYGVLFKKDDELTREALTRNLTWVNAQLAGKDWLLGQQFGVADAYLFTVLSWSKTVGIDTAKWSNIMGFRTRMRNRPAVNRALKAEGLL
jgi:glutathione S-transferase